MLNRVAVTTLLFIGSTAPTATSGVSTTATNFGGAVNTAALPNLIANPLLGVIARGEGLIGVIGEPGETFSDRRPLKPGVLLAEEGGPWDIPSVVRRAGVTNDVDREREEVVRRRFGVVGRSASKGLSRPPLAVGV